MVTQILLIGGGAALGGLLLGALIGAMLTARRMRAQVEEIGEEVVRLHKVAQDKLSGDDPDLKTLLRNLNTAVEQTYRAVDALEDQAELTRRKSQGGKEVIASSRHIIGMIEEMGGDVPHMSAPPEPSNPVIEVESDDKSPRLR